METSLSEEGELQATGKHEEINMSNMPPEPSTLDVPMADAERSLEQESKPITKSSQTQAISTDDDDWTGWAELENDPAIFTTLVEEWGVSSVRVDEIYDLDMIFQHTPTDTLGLIFLSRYAPPEESPSGRETQTVPNEIPNPWFANQISKYSCGTVALMNIIMNATDLTLSNTLSDFKSLTSSMPPKACGIHLDTHSQLRSTHNSFATKLDRLIVDLNLKEDVQAAKQRSYKASKRKKGKGSKRKKNWYDEDEEEPAFHFVAYLSAHNAVWRLDGLEAAPRMLGLLQDADVAWTQQAAQDIQNQMLNAQVDGMEFSLLSVTKYSATQDKQAASNNLSKTESDSDSLNTMRMREDWAPFIETILRIHADRGDLNELLGL